MEKAVELLRAGIHLMVLDLFPPGPRDPQGIHKAIWDEFIDNEFELPPDKPLTLASYMVDTWPEAFVEPIAVGDSLPEMPLFLAPGTYIPAPLDGAYKAACEAVPSYWRDVVSGRIEHRKGWPLTCSSSCKARAAAPTVSPAAATETAPRAVITSGNPRAARALAGLSARKRRSIIEKSPLSAAASLPCLVSDSLICSFPWP